MSVQFVRVNRNVIEYRFRGDRGRITDWQALGDDDGDAVGRYTVGRYCAVPERAAGRVWLVVQVFAGGDALRSIPVYRVVNRFTGQILDASSLKVADLY
jgi:hypothetical protein